MQNCLWLEDVSWFLYQLVIWTNSESLKEKVHNFCLVYIFFMEKYWNFLLRPYLIKENDKKPKLKTCLDLGLWSYVQVQGHWKKKLCIHYFPIEKFLSYFLSWRGWRGIIHLWSSNLSCNGQRYHKISL